MAEETPTPESPEPSKPAKPKSPKLVQKLQRQPKPTPPTAKPGFHASQYEQPEPYAIEPSTPEEAQTIEAEDRAFQERLEKYKNKLKPVAVESSVVEEAPVSSQASEQAHSVSEEEALLQSVRDALKLIDHRAPYDRDYVNKKPFQQTALVYADWLEDRGDISKAEAIRKIAMSTSSPFWGMGTDINTYFGLTKREFDQALTEARNWKWDNPDDLYNIQVTAANYPNADWEGDALAMLRQIPYAEAIGAEGDYSRYWALRRVAFKLAVADQIRKDQKGY